MLKFFPAALAACAFLLATPSQAATITINFPGIVNAHDPQADLVTVSTPLTSAPLPGFADMFNLEVTAFTGQMSTAYVDGTFYCMALANSQGRCKIHFRVEDPFDAVKLTGIVEADQGGTVLTIEKNGQHIQSSPGGQSAGLFMFGLDLLQARFDQNDYFTIGVTGSLWSDMLVRNMVLHFIPVAQVYRLVPEPSSAMLVGLALLLLSTKNWTRKRPV